MNDKELLGLKIRTLRKQKNYTQEKLAEIAEISTRHMVKIEMGQVFPTINILLKIAKEFNIPLKSLFEYEYLNNISELKEKLINQILNLDENNLRMLYKISTVME